MLSKLANLFEATGSTPEASPSHPLKGWVDLPRLHHLLPYESYDESTKLFYNKDSTGFVLLGQPLAGASLQDQSQLSQFFKQKEFLPEGCSMQFLLNASPRIFNRLDNWASYRLPGQFQKLAQQRVEFLKAKVNGEDIFNTLRDFRMVISYTLPGHILDPVRQEQLMDIRRQLKDALEIVGMPTTDVDATGLIRELAGLINLKNDFYVERREWNPHDVISKQIIDADINFAIEPDQVTIGDICLKSFVPKDYPDYWALPHMERFLGDALAAHSSIPCPYIMHYGIFVEQQQGRAKAKANAKREALENALKNRMTKWMASLEDQYHESDACIRELNNGERVILTCLSTTLIAPREQIRKAESKLRNIWQGAGWEATPTTYDHLPMFLGSLPMTWTWGQESNFSSGSLGKTITGYGKDLQKMGKAKRTVTKEAQNMLPIIAEWKGQSTPGMILYGRRGQLFNWNPFAQVLLPDAKAQDAQTNHDYNVCIAGQPGSGKSVFMQEMMTSVLSIGGKVFVMDYGRSFKNACQLLNGQYIEFDIKKPLSLNPFSTIPTGNTPEEIEEREELLAMIKPILQVMAAPKLGTTDLQNSLLERALRHAWDANGQNTSIDHIQKYLLERGDDTARDLGEMLYSYSSNGVYGRFFTGAAQINLNSDFVVIETDFLRNHPNLMTLVVQMMIVHINHTMSRGNKKQPFLIMIDEAWKLLMGKDSGDFIAEATRTTRKYKGSIVLATQLLTDYFKPESPAATQAFNNSSWKCILYQEANVIEGLKNHPQLRSYVDCEYKESLLRSIQPKPPHYSEVAIFGQGINGIIGRLSLDKYSRLLYTTNPVEYGVLESYVKQGFSIDEAINQAINSGSV